MLIEHMTITPSQLIHIPVLTHFLPLLKLSKPPRLILSCHTPPAHRTVGRRSYCQNAVPSFLFPPLSSSSPLAQALNLEHWVRKVSLSKWYCSGTQNWLVSVLAKTQEAGGFSQASCSVKRPSSQLVVQVSWERAKIEFFLCTSGCLFGSRLKKELGLWRLDFWEHAYITLSISSSPEITFTSSLMHVKIHTRTRTYFRLHFTLVFHKQVLTLVIFEVIWAVFSALCNVAKHGFNPC